MGHREARGVHSQQRKRKQQRRAEKQLDFEPGKVFVPAPKHDLADLTKEMRDGLRAFKAKKGEGGNRGGPHRSMDVDWAPTPGLTTVTTG